ncbi:sigma-70 family RNA polymerase sigma factor [Bradyrhizobium sp. Leo121]|uniref:RNA polymerase sigma factor n=1 Tax=Bradyrhizobium sp. Leo121 TaxID=1571195 RepID=UPI001029ADA5|nr:sigma-70 family RNA polymerase sigma factor [Bradyrhizobium sp. Leo121]RZN26686.1 RNA polymerase subunit sigma-70 [Bradyrhizobium sp. Leo121]
MTDAALSTLRRLFIDRYDDLKARLTKRLGSADLAGDALHDTWVRLSRADSVGVVQSPDSYLFRAVLNAAEDQRRADKRHLTAIEIDSLFDLADETPGPEQALQARSDLQTFESVLAELPPRRRAILLARRLDGLSREEIAARLGVSIRLVTKELRLAHEHCVARFRNLQD